METIRIWEGVKGSNNGYDNSDYEILEFDGTLLGSWQLSYDDRDNRGVSFDIYQAADGAIIIHRVNWSRWAAENNYGYIYEFPSLEEAAASKEEAVNWRFVLENAGLIERRKHSIDEWRQKRFAQ